MANVISSGWNNQLGQYEHRMSDGRNVARTAEAWWEWHDADYDRASEDVETAETRCAQWVSGQGSDGPEVV